MATPGPLGMRVYGLARSRGSASPLQRPLSPSQAPDWGHPDSILGLNLGCRLGLCAALHPASSLWCLWQASGARPGSPSTGSALGCSTQWGCRCAQWGCRGGLWGPLCMPGRLVLGQQATDTGAPRSSPADHLEAASRPPAPPWEARQPPPASILSEERVEPSRVSPGKGVRQDPLLPQPAGLERGEPARARASTVWLLQAGGTRGQESPVVSCIRGRGRRLGVGSGSWSPEQGGHRAPGFTEER